ncbi:MAG: radical SAM protein [Phycisphaerales bacterium]|nr:radical SAM protein [Phycisphaerales bacterium]
MHTTHRHDHSLIPPEQSPALPCGAPPLHLLFWESTVACNLECIHCRRLEVASELSKYDLTTAQVKNFISTLPEVGKPIFVFSGGEPLKRPDLFELTEHTRSVGLPTALATNGTLITEAIARQIVEVGIRRVSISFDGPDAQTHDHFRGKWGGGAFDAAVAGAKLLRKQNISLQINATIARHNYASLDRIYNLALSLNADALHLFMLVPVGCGMELPESIMLQAAEYEKALHWIHDRSLEGKLHMKATCAPHYFRVMRQRGKKPEARSQKPEESAPVHSPSGSRLLASGFSPATKGCLAGQAIAFVSHTGEVFPCGYLPVTSGNVTATSFPKIWRESKVFADMRDDSRLEGKCGVCEFKKVCMGCRARAYAATGNYLAEEPNCDFIPTRIRT